MSHVTSLSYNHASVTSRLLMIASRRASGVECALNRVSSSACLSARTLSAASKQVNQSDVFKLSTNDGVCVRIRQSVQLNICAKTTLSCCFIPLPFVSGGGIAPFTDQDSPCRSSAGVVFRGHRQMRGMSLRVPVRGNCDPIKGKGQQDKVLQRVQIVSGATDTLLHDGQRRNTSATCFCKPTVRAVPQDAGGHAT